MHCTVWIDTFRSGPRREIDGTSLSSSPDTGAEIPHSNHRSSILRSSHFPKASEALHACFMMLLIMLLHASRPFPTGNLEGLLLRPDNFQATGAGQSLLLGQDGQQWVCAAPGRWGSPALPAVLSPAACLAGSLLQRPLTFLFLLQDVLVVKNVNSEMPVNKLCA